MADASSKKILLVEDEDLIRDLYERLLKNEGYTVQTASDGEQAYNAIKSTAYDLVLLDVMLPKMDGIAALEKLNNTGATKNDSIVMLTNLDQQIAIAKGVSLGVKGYLIKSQTTNEALKKEVKNYLGL